MCAPDLLDLLDDASDGRGAVRFWPDDERVPFAELWTRAGRAAQALRARVDERTTVAAVLSTSADAIATLVGGWRAGLTVASLPLPARGMSGDAYAEQVDALCKLVDARLLLVADDDRGHFANAQTPVEGFAALVASPRRVAGADAGRGSFVQLTSGTTAAPKGVRLSLDALASNILAVLEALAPSADDVSCSWLPLSHDLGLIGMCLLPWAANGPRVLGGGDAVLLRPTQVGSWLDACSTARATFTAAPTFALDLAARTLRRQLDLSPLRACIVGSETVRAATLEAFARATARAGLRDGALCPAYGLAEATLAVSMVRPGEQWRSVEVDPFALVDGEWREAGDGRPLVGNGRPVRDVAVRVAGGAVVGPLEIRTPAAALGYVGADEPLLVDGWLRTNDVGAVVDGQVYVAGRVDDVLAVGGRKLHARELELAAATVPGVRADAVAVVDDEAGRYAVVAERRAGADAPELAAEVRELLVTRVGLGPSSVVFVTRGTLPKTPSGKTQRHRVRALRAARTLEVEAEVDFAW
jgi:acyl-CoA synthetase (AMP-forming)/AMP-acid ligase II